MIFPSEPSLQAFGFVVRRIYKRHGMSQKRFRQLCGIGTPQLRAILQANH